MIRKRKNFSRPKKLYDLARIKQENILVSKYGLKNKREIWRADAAVARIRNQAKKLITESEEKKEEFYNKLNKMGFKVTKIADVLDLDKEDWLGRRLQSLLIAKKLAKPKEARQLIAHKHVEIDGKKINIPGYIVSVDEEYSIKVIKTPIKIMEKVENE